MKKIKLISIFLILSLLLITLTGCGKNKDSISTQDFSNKMTNKNFIVQDSTYQYSSNPEIKKSYIAMQEDYNYQIEFIELESEKDAKNMYSTNKQKFEDSINDSHVNKEVNVANYSKYSLSNDGKYKVLSRIGNTLIYIDANDKYTDEIKSILDDLGY